VRVCAAAATASRACAFCLIVSLDTCSSGGGGSSCKSGKAWTRLRPKLHTVHGVHGRAVHGVDLHLEGLETAVLFVPWTCCPGRICFLLRPYLHATWLHGGRLAVYSAV